MWFDSENKYLKGGFVQNNILAEEMSNSRWNYNNIILRLTILRGFPT